MPAPVEGRYLAYAATTSDQNFEVKGRSLGLAALLGSEEEAKAFVGGPLLLARLSPMDYHRFHYPDEGMTLKQVTISGKLNSVSPFAFQQKPKIYLENERRVSILETKHFGRLAYIEVGALCVGKIVQTHDPRLPFSRGEEKGYFQFGGSTVIVLGQPGTWVPDPDLLSQTDIGRETLVRLGSQVGRVE